jgi:outer membrane receptor protein involved in Fe transport
MAVSLQGSTELERRILNLDYERYITPSFKFEAGVKDRYLSQERHLSVFIHDNTEYATDFTYLEHIQAAYMILEYTTFMEDMVFSGGVRVEEAKAEGIADLDSVLFNLTDFPSASIADRTNYLTRYMKWYPSFLVRYKPNLFTTVQTGYSARVNRPTADFVDPFPRNLFEPSVIRTGNPNLEPEFIHAFELKLSQIKPAWNWEAALFGQQIENVVREDEDMLTDTTSVITWKNVGMGTNVGMEGRVKFNLFPFWDITLTGLYFRTETDHTEEDDLTGTLSGFQGKLSQVFTFSGGGKLELDSRFYSPEQIPTGTVYPNGLANLNVTYRRSLWNDRLELSLKLLDAFDNEERKSETSEMELSGGFRKLVVYTKPDRRTFFLNIKYKFGTAGKKSISKNTREAERYRY